MKTKRTKNQKTGASAFGWGGVIVLVLLFAGCMGSEDAEIKILEKIDLNSLPGASGIGLQQGRYWVIGDDARTCHLYNADFKLVDTLVIPSMASIPSENGRIPKELKADLEALVVVSDIEVLALGSGSKPSRETAVHIKGQGNYTIEEYTLRKFYKALRALPEMKKSELNIEAAAMVGDQLYLFNRPNGLMISLHYRDFMLHISEGAPMPEPKTHRLNAPSAHGVQAGISGAAFDPTSGRLILTASLERTSNAYDDGEILGSYIGYVRVNGDDWEEVSWSELPTDGETMKIESVEVLSYNEKEKNYELIMTVDNDNGRSELLKVHYRP